TTVPFFTLLSGEASLTDAVITSPSVAIRPVEPPSGRIIEILRAPELSATSKMVRICIMTKTSLAGRRLSALSVQLKSFIRWIADRRPLAARLTLRRQDLNHIPAFPPAQRARLFDAHLVPDFAPVGLIMRHELRGLADDLAIQRMLDKAIHRDHD